MRPARVAVPLLAALLALGAPRAALADDEPVPSPRPTAPDNRTGRPTLALQYGVARLMGKAEENRSHASILGWGSAPSLQLAIPFHRDFAAEIWGSYATFGGDSSCDINGKNDCKGTSMALGVGAVYHLVDGIPFDPWLSAGFGYRRTTLESPTVFKAEQKFTYSGVEFLRLSVGSDYYPIPLIGIGPFLEFTFGRYSTRSPGELTDGAGHTGFGAGLRLVLNPF